MLFSRRILPVIALSIALLAPQVAAAQGFDLQQFNPMPDVEGNFFDTSSADVAPHMTWSGMLLFAYNNDPLVRRDEEGETIDKILRHQGTTHLLFSLGIMDRFELGVDIPVIVLQRGSGLAGPDIDPGDGGFGIGDLRLVPKAQIYSGRDHVDDNGIAVAMLVDAHLPTGNDDVLQGGDFRIGPRLALDAVIGGPRVGLNLGYQYRDEQRVENLVVRDTLSWNIGLEVPIVDHLAATAEIFGRLTPGADELRREESPTEAVAGIKFNRQGLRLVAGGGAGLINGYGTPDARVFAGLGWSHPPATVEPIEEPTEPEPEPEPDCRPATVQTDCPDVPETTCEAGLLQSYTATCDDGECTYPVTETECATGTQCGLDDGVAACVPEPDCTADGECTETPPPTCQDAVLTNYAGQCLDGSCHYEPTETPCGEDMECGLRDGTPACVEATDLVEVDEEQERIEILEVVNFAVNSDEIEAESYNLLNQVAQVLDNNPHLELIRIEGHTDITGSRDYNIQLSQERAESVLEYLVSRGIAPDRLSAIGLGPDEPIADNDTEAGRAQNRRVEFHIEERN